MGGWTEDNLLKFMQVHSDVFGESILQIKDAEQEWICKTFTNRLFSLLDWTQVVETPYVDVRFVGKGDVDKITVKKDFCLTSTQCADIANFIAGRTSKLRNNELLSFTIINYIQYDINLYTNYMAVLKKIVQQSFKGGE